MDKQTAKEILSAYRQNGSDAPDHNFQEALSLCRNDPEMTRWLESECAHDRRFAQALNSIKAPASSRAALLATVEFEGPSPSARGKIIHTLWWRVSAIAAIIAIGLSVFIFFRQGYNHLIARNNGEAVQYPKSWISSVAMLASTALPLDRLSPNLEELTDWLAQNGSPTVNALPGQLQKAAKLAGCRAIEMPDGRRVSLICFRYGDELVHVFIADKSAFDDIPGQEDDAWSRKDGWNLYTWSTDSQVMAVASKLPRETLSRVVQGA